MDRADASRIILMLTYRTCSRIFGSHHSIFRYEHLLPFSSLTPFEIFQVSDSQERASSIRFLKKFLQSASISASANTSSACIDGKFNNSFPNRQILSIKNLFRALSVLYIYCSRFQIAGIQAVWKRSLFIAKLQIVPVLRKSF